MQVPPEVWKVLSADDRARFEARLADYLEQLFPEQLFDQTRPQILQRVHALVDRALSYGIDVEEDVAVFASLAFRLGFEFDVDPEHVWARNILTCNALSSSEKATMLTRALEPDDDPESG